MLDIKDDNETLCFCMNVKYKEVIDAIRKNNLKTIDEVGEYIKAGTGCGGCRGNIKLLLDEIAKEKK